MEGMNIARISEDMFRINKYTFTKVPFLDVVTTSAPYFHFQILEPEDEEQRAKAINYFKENEKTYISFVDDTTILPSSVALNPSISVPPSTTTTTSNNSSQQ